MHTRTLNEAWSACTGRVEEGLRGLFASDRETQPQILLYDAMDYSLLAGGKRLRPFLVYSFCELAGGRPEQADCAAMAVEMIHTYSLIHDDLPAMDNDDYRRGRLTNHKVYGEAVAILAGDGLLTDAFRVLAGSGLPPERIAECVRILSDCAGSRGMVGGQVLDILAESRQCTEDEVIQIHRRKTGALIRAACCMGVVCGGGDQAALRAAERYAEALGLAFQYRDDILDVIGDAGKLGKATGADAHKNTFVKLYGVEHCQRLVLEQTAAAKAAVAPYPGAQILCELADALAERDN